MGFFIDCIRGAEISHDGIKSKISHTEIQQLPDETEMVSSPRFKGDDEEWRASFSAQTKQGSITWHVLFTMGDTDPSLGEVSLASAPAGVIVESDPEFAITYADD